MDGDLARYCLVISIAILLVISGNPVMLELERKDGRWKISCELSGMDVGIKDVLLRRPCYVCAVD